MQRHTAFAVILLSASVLTAGTNYRPLNVKLGLWQVTEVSTTSGAPPVTPEMQARIDKMSPEQRARMEEMIKSRFGGTPRTTQYQKCVTAKDLNSNPFTNGPDEKCNWTIVNSTGSDMEARGTECAAGEAEGLKTDVDIKLHAVNTETVNATVLGTASGNGNTINIDNKITGKWIGANCPAGTE